MRSGVARKTRWRWIVPVAMVCSPYITEVGHTPTTIRRRRYRRRLRPGKTLRRCAVHIRNRRQAYSLGVAHCAGPPGVPVGALVARRDIELGFQQLSELMHLPCIHVTGPMPADVKFVTVFSAGIRMASRRKDAAKAFFSFLALSPCNQAKLSQGIKAAFR
ncbi:substrate-binding domain-containing protein [Paraburkholderia sp. BL17N1]|uniref:substrate-binding domain-containing protein n=1 Tax=Paraburkholderia sp. BL17N1 TaxID=1938798 RepID=UPI0032207B83